MENDDSSVCNPLPCWLFNECFNRSAGAGSNAETQGVAQEIKYQTAGEDRFEMQVDRAVLSTSQSSLEIDSVTGITVSFEHRERKWLKASSKALMSTVREVVKFRVLSLARMDQLHL